MGVFDLLKSSGEHSCTSSFVRDDTKEIRKALREEMAEIAEEINPTFGKVARTVNKFVEASEETKSY